MKIRFLLSTLLVVLYTFLSAQKVDYNVQPFKAKKLGTISPSTIAPGFNATITNLEAPNPDGKSLKAHIMELKKQASQRFPRTKAKYTHQGKSSAENLIVRENFELKRYIESLDSLVILGGGNPLDNTMAISDDGMLVAAVNSRIFMSNVNQELNDVYKNSLVISFEDFASSLNRTDVFDPKVLYDPEEDRFILAFLSGRTPAYTGIVVGFSQTNDPMGDWNVYLLEGNPLNDNTWTDFPAMTITEDELFITGNLIINGVSWQEGFNGTIVWQVDKFSGYNNDATLTTQLWSDLKHDGSFVRNFFPVNGSLGTQPSNVYFISNRNFALYSDSIYLIEITDNMSNSPSIDISLLHTDVNYGFPPNGRQEDDDPNDDTDGLQTNDARALGGFIHNDRIQFVGNTMNPTTGLSAVYHGTIENVSINPVVTGNIIGHSTRDFGYPNITFTGQEEDDIQCIISFNHTSPTDYAGVSAVYYADDGTYSDIITLVEGRSYVDKIFGGYERWGDYFGLQTMYSKPGHVWLSGFYGETGERSNTWVSHLVSPDTIFIDPPDDCDDFEVVSRVIELSNLNDCLGEIDVNISGGTPPYITRWNGMQGDTIKDINLCEDNVFLVVTDSNNCRYENVFTYNLVQPNNSVYPNPVSSLEEINLYFELSEPAQVDVEVYGIDGKLIKQMLSEQAREGKNQLSFSIGPLDAGMYVLVVRSGDNEIINQRIVKE